jgi:phage gpG-like protein
MGVRGDFSGLDDLRARLSELASGAARKGMVRVLAEEAVKQLDDEFRQSRDPYGRPWAPLTSRVGKPLLDTGTHLRSGLAPKLSASGFTISTPFKGAAVHQYGAVIRPVKAKALAFRVRGVPTASRKRGKAGTVFAQQVTIPRRQYMPEGDIGPIWGGAFERAADSFLRRHMGRS